VLVIVVRVDRRRHDVVEFNRQGLNPSENGPMFGIEDLTEGCSLHLSIGTRFNWYSVTTELSEPHRDGAAWGPKG
jgi:hypothetical protein